MQSTSVYLQSRNLFHNIMCLYFSYTCSSLPQPHESMQVQFSRLSLALKYNQHPIQGVCIIDGVSDLARQGSSGLRSHVSGDVPVTPTSTRLKNRRFLPAFYYRTFRGA